MDRENTSDAGIIALAAEPAGIISLPGVDEDVVNAVIDAKARIVARMARTRAPSLDGVITKARICRAIAVPRTAGDFGDPPDRDQWWPLLRSIFEDLQQVPLDDTNTMRAVVAELLGQDNAAGGNAEARES